MALDGFGYERRLPGCHYMRTLVKVIRLDGAPLGLQRPVAAEEPVPRRSHLGEIDHRDQQVSPRNTPGFAQARAPSATWAVLLSVAMLLAACHQGRGGSDLPGDPDDHQPFSRIAESDTVRLNGTEPFWGGEVASGTFTYTTPERIDGIAIPVERFAGRAGVSFTGELDGSPVALMITDGQCSDGMSDRRYPFTATLKIGDEQREGCASTDAHPATSPAGPAP